MTTMNTGAASLLPCPFCGSAARLQPAFGNDLWWVACATCDFEANPQKTREATVAAWNRRATTPQADAAPTFEAWATKEGLISESHGVRFVNSMCDVARKAWDAAIAAGGAQEPTGDAQADRIINRLMSSDPDFDDCSDAADLIRRLMYERRADGKVIRALVADAAPLPRVAATVLTDEQMMAAIKSVCGFDAEKAEQWRPEALTIGRAVERALLAASNGEQA